MAGKKKEEAPKKVLSLIEQQEARLSGVKVGDSVMVDIFKYAEEYSDIEVVTFSSGFPNLDRALNPLKPGIPLQRHIEIATDQPSVGKSTLTMQIVASGQRQGLQACLAEPEATHTIPYLNKLGVVTKFDPSRPGIYPLRIMRPEWDLQNEASILHSAENYLNALGKAVDLFDITVVDSAAALCPGVDVLKDADEAALVGGISKLLHGWFRKHTHPRSVVFWVNQYLDQVGKFSPNPGGPAKQTVGGKAIPFYCGIRLKGARVGSIEVPGQEDPIGYESEWTLVKNKVGGEGVRRVRLPYLNGEGFSVPYATFNYAVAQKVIQQNGAWYQFPTGDMKTNPGLEDAFGFMRTQGKIPFYEALRTREDTMAAIMAVIRGEDPEDLRPEFEAKNLAVERTEAAAEGASPETLESPEETPEPAKPKPALKGRQKLLTDLAGNEKAA